MTENYNNKKQIPIFFACDNNYAPILAVALTSLIENATADNLYLVNILCGSDNEKLKELTKMSTNKVLINIYDVSDKISEISDILDNVRDYYTQTIFYRIFIASCFPQYDKAIYLDSDIVVLNDLEKFYDIDLGNNIFGAIVDDIVSHNEDFKVYTKEAVGVDADHYFNSGVLLMNLKAFRYNQIEEKFINTLVTYDFDVVASDQDYLNYLCKGKIKYLDKSWDLMPVEEEYHGKINLIHYNMFLKPWHYDIKYDNYFWQYAKKTKYYQMLKECKENYDESKKKEDYEGVSRMVKLAYDIINSKYNFACTLMKKENKDE